MCKKLILLGSIFSLIFVANHTPWIEELFNLGYAVGQCVPSYLLFIIITILFIKNK